jgi:hypothetical protein
LFEFVPIWYSIYADEKKKKREKGDLSVNTNAAKQSENIENRASVSNAILKTMENNGAVLNESKGKEETSENASTLPATATHFDPSVGIDPTQEEEKLPLSYYRNLVRQRKGLEPLPEEIESESVCFNEIFAVFFFVVVVILFCELFFWSHH